LCDWGVRGVFSIIEDLEKEEAPRARPSASEWITSPNVMDRACREAMLELPPGVVGAPSESMRVWRFELDLAPSKEALSGARA
jgi:hypothetical protein